MAASWLFVLHFGGPALAAEPFDGLEASKESELAAACEASQFQSVLRAAAPSDPLVVQAYWLDRNRLQWPRQAVIAGARYKLYHSASAALQVRLGQTVSGADSVLDLQIDAQPLPAELRQRFKFIADGPRLRLSKADRPRLAELLQGQVLLVQIDAQGQALAATALQTPGALDDLYAGAEAAADLGVTVAGASTRFKLWAPTAQAVHLCRYSGSGVAAQAMRRDAKTGIWSAGLAADLSGGYYSYLVDVMVAGAGLVRNRVTDPYSISLNTDSQRSYIADLAAPALKPTGWDGHPARRIQRATEMVIYELHVRDFSINDASVAAAHRGKFLAFTEPRSNGMRHLRALAAAGLSDVHLLPVFDIASIPEAGCTTPTVAPHGADSEAPQAAVMAMAATDCFNWGYDPYHYSAPEGSYASDANDGARRVLEMRAMVLSLHRANLRVGMDVVYNHSAAAGQQAQSVLDRIVPGYYHRLDALGRIERSTCCDNTATEHRMMAKLMVDSVALWAREYRIDSFRFDLMAHQPRAVMEALQRRVDAAAGRPVQLIGEGWNFGEVADGARFVQASQLSLNGSGIATFSDRGRDAARGGGAADSGDVLLQNQGWLNGLVYAPNQHAPERPVADLMQAADLIRVGLAGSLRDYPLTTWTGERRRLADIAYGNQPAGYVAEPAEVVNYVDNHDNQTLFDIHVLKLPRTTSREDRARVQMLGVALTAFSQGVAYFHAGVDLLRSKSLDRNSYDSGDWFNRLDWSYQDNYFGSGLPPKADNGELYPLLRGFLTDPGIKPGPAEIAWSRDVFRDLLKIRASSGLLRLSSSAEVQQRLRFLNTGPGQNPAVIAAALNGRGLADAGFKRLLYFINAHPETQTLSLPSEIGAKLQLHPVHLAPQAADRRPVEQARFDAATGLFTLPGRTALVFVQP